MNFETTADEDNSLVQAPGPADAIELLTADHEDVRILFADYEDLVADDASATDRAHLAKQICNALIAHATIEEELFYPAARESVDQPQLLDQAEAEHRSAKALIAQIQGTDPTSPQFDIVVMQLQAAVAQHVQDEEGEIFPQMQGSGIDLQQLGEQLAQRRDEVLDELEQTD